MSLPGENLIGARLGPCRIVARLGKGAMGVVYRARHDAHGEVCVKVISPGLRCEGEMLRRFRREAEAAARIDDPHVVRSFGLEEVDGHQVLVQELVEGGDLDRVLAAHGGKVTLGEALRVAREVALGLAAAHAAGIVHRDLKPGNVFVDARGRVKLGDLGLILQVDGEPLDGKTILTQKGQTLGTPAFMAPEQWREAHEVDARADLYALGVLLHQLLSGRRPFEARSVNAIMVQHMREPPPPVREHAPDVPEPVEALVLALLAKDPADRPPSARAVASLLERIADELGLGTKVRGEGELDGTVLLGSETVALGEAAPAADPVGATAGADPVGATSPGTMVGSKFRIEGELGKGGMGVVYRARHTLLEQDFALKLISPRLAGDREFRQRFLREARALMAFSHRGAVSLRDFGEHAGGLYMAMDLAPGEPLRALMRRDGPFDQARALGIARQVLECLQEAHATGLVHRDLKPENLLVERREGEDRVQILDFGIAKLLDDEGGEGAAAPTRLTSTGVSIGTPHYMSPEQDSGDPVDARSDLYSFACVLYETIAGRRPLDAETVRKLRHKIQTEAPPPLHAAAGGRVSEPFAAAVMKALAKEPADRPQNARDFLASLERAAAGAPAPPAAEAPAARARGGHRPGSKASAKATAGARGSRGARGGPARGADATARSVVRLLVGIGLILAGTIAFGCCGCVGGFMLSGGRSSAERAARIAKARVVTPEQAMLAKGLVCIENVIPQVSEPVFPAEGKAAAIYYEASTVESIDPGGGATPTTSSTTYEEDRVARFRIGPVTVAPARASFEMTEKIFERGKTTYRGIRIDQPITIIGEVDGGTIDDGDPFLITTVRSHAQILDDVRSSARTSRTMGLIGLGLGPVLFLVGLFLVIKR